MPEGLCQRKIPITYRELNLWPSGLQRNASTNCATACPLEPEYVFRFSCDQSPRWHSVSQSITCSSPVSMECSPKDCEMTRIFLRINQCNVTDFEKRTNRDTRFSLFMCVAREKNSVIKVIVQRGRRAHPVTHQRVTVIILCPGKAVLVQTS